MKLVDRLERALPWLAAAVAVGLLALAAVIIVRSLPPRQFTILTGREGGGYYRAAQEYRRIAADNGFTLDVRPTAGSVETLRLLESGEAGIGFVQGGTAVDADPAVLGTLASVFYEPVWIFYQSELGESGPLHHLYELEGLRLAIGEPASGNNRLCRQLLAANGVTEANSTFMELPTDDAAAGLREGWIDAALIVVSAESDVVQTLLRDSSLDLMDVTRAAAYPSQFPYLTSIVLPEGSVDLRGGIPAEDKHLISTVANLIVRRDFHPDLLRLMTIAAVETHETGGMFEQRYEFPNTQYADLPVDLDERAYLEEVKAGQSALDNYLPFWAAALVDRYLLFLLPVAALGLLLLARSPLLLTTLGRRRITRWYRTVRTIDMRLGRMDAAELADAERTLDEIDALLHERVSTSETYLHDFYDLRGYVDLVRERLLKRRAALADAAA